MMDELMDRVERIPEHGVIVAIERDGVVAMHPYPGGSTLRAVAEKAIDAFDLKARDAPPAAIWGDGRLYAAINDAGGRVRVAFFVCPHCLRPKGDAIHFNEWMLSMAGASTPPHRCR